MDVKIFTADGGFEIFRMMFLVCEGLLNYENRRGWIYIHYSQTVKYSSSLIGLLCICNVKSYSASHWERGGGDLNYIEAGTFNGFNILT